MIVVGLTGSIGMGKTTTARLFAEEGVPVYDADAAVHALYAEGGAAVGPIGAAFPGVVEFGAVDRAKLAAAVVADPATLKRLEAIVHPLVAEEQRRFLEAQRDAGAKLVVLDIPLLFETGGDRRVDVVVVASAPAHVQRERVLARPGMTPEKLDALLEKQLADHEKRARAHFVVETGEGLEAARERVRDVLAVLAGSVSHAETRS